jgi:3-oxoacyl-[acyl-carrier protein] reductase
LVTNSVLRTLFLSAKYATPAIEKRGGGVIFTVAAGHKVRQDANYTYGSARGAQISAAENLARALYQKNIRAHCICPGIIWDRPSSWEESIKPAPRQLERLGNPIDIAYAALYLSSDESAWLTGQVINIEGGDDLFVGSPLRRTALEGRYGPD